MSKIAVLIPTYRPKEYIESCLSSLENQTLSKQDFCVYIALNGPRQPYESYLKSILEPLFIQYKLIYISDPGVSNARNYLINSSKEPFIVFIDDDDRVSSNYLEALLQVSTSQFMGISNIKCFENDISSLKPNYIGNSFNKIKTGETSKIKTRKYYSSPVAKMLHRDMLVDTSFNVKLSHGEDSLFMTEISPNISGVNKTKDDVYYYVYLRPGSTTRSKINKKDEIKRILFLSNAYFSLLCSKKYSKIFILSRMAATIKHLQNVFK